jgi:hypothetical protein
MHGHMNVQFVTMHGHMNVQFVTMHGHMNVKFVTMHGHMNVQFVTMHSHMDVQFVTMHGHMNVKFMWHREIIINLHTRVFPLLIFMEMGLLENELHLVSKSDMFLPLSRLK